MPLILQGGVVCTVKNGLHQGFPRSWCRTREPSSPETWSLRCASYLGSRKLGPRGTIHRPTDLLRGYTRHYRGWSASSIQKNDGSGPSTSDPCWSPTMLHGLRWPVTPRTSLCSGRDPGFLWTCYSWQWTNENGPIPSTNMWRLFISGYRVPTANARVRIQGSKDAKMALR